MFAAIPCPNWRDPYQSVPSTNPKYTQWTQWYLHKLALPNPRHLFSELHHLWKMNLVACHSTFDSTRSRRRLQRKHTQRSWRQWWTISCPRIFFWWYRSEVRLGRWGWGSSRLWCKSEGYRTSLGPWWASLACMHFHFNHLSRSRKAWRSWRQWSPDRARFCLWRRMKCLCDKAFEDYRRVGSC